MNLSLMTYTDAYDIGAEDAWEGRPPRTARPKRANVSPGRRGYIDGYTDASSDDYQHACDRCLHPRKRSQLTKVSDQVTAMVCRDGCSFTP